ncbi:MAG: glycosyl hydrolase [Dysosmobacter sp.]
MEHRELEELYRRLRAPENALRSAPFWGWNSKLDPEELTVQIRDMKEKGLGGCFIHSREGLETPYLSGEWIEDVETSVQAAEDAGLELWIYDEDKWPSGSAGGKVAAADPERFTAKALTLEIIPYSPEKCPEGGDVIGTYRVEIDGREIRGFGSGDTLLILRREISGTSEWYNGSAPSDNLNADAVRMFIDLTHEKYRERFSQEFGSTIKGFFTDEPDFCDFYSSFTAGRPWLPWTDDFIAAFTARRGYSPEKYLPLLFFDGQDSAMIHHDYWRTLSELFGERYMKQLYDWCEGQGLSLTGHMLYENDLGYNIRVCGAAMPQYRYLHCPGVDILGEQTREYLTVKQCTSVANQYGRQTVISETYGCTGWEFDFEGQKWLGDWQFVMGVTRRCQHMMLYSIAGCRKRDYPPVFNYQSSWWQSDRLIEDYYGRLAACTTAGSPVREILVIHPISSLWTKCACAPDEDLGRVDMNTGWSDAHITALNEEGDTYNRLAEMLMRAHRDFDFGDETILAEAAHVDGSTFTVGQASYSTVIVPKVCSLFASTLELLEQYVRNGGRLIWVGDLPEMTEGRPGSRAEALFEKYGFARVDTYEELPGVLDKVSERPFSITGRLGEEASDLLAMFRQVGEDRLLFVTNQDRNESHWVKIRLPDAYGVTAYDPWTGKFRPVPAERTGAGVTFADTLPAACSRVYFLRTGEAGASVPCVCPYEHPHRSEKLFAVLGPTASFSRAMPNALVLDRCSYSLNGSPFSACTDIWRAQKEIREALGMQQIYYNGAPMRYMWVEDEQKKPGVPFALRLTFTVRDVPENPCRFVMENPQGLEILCNGVPCREDGGWYVDKSMRTLTLPKLAAGENVIEIRGGYRGDRELEDVFVTGDFGVSPDREIVREPEKLHFGDWCMQGYIHYPGDMVYHFTAPAYHAEDGRIVLTLGEHSAALVEITVNGQTAGHLFGKGYNTLDITNLLTDGENAVDIRLAGTPRNLFGPFHQKYTDCTRISWADFRTEGILYTPDYVLKPYGLFHQVKLIKENGEGQL